jgi:C1A family cysteine protease
MTSFILAAYEFLTMKNINKHIDVSRLFIYYNSRLMDPLEKDNIQDNGTTITNAVKALTEYGCCEEKSFPYDLTKINEKPPDHCYEEASQYRISKAMKINVDLNEMKACLAQSYPFAFGLHLFEPFNQSETNGGMVPKPSADSEAQNHEHEWHAMLAVGYDDQLQCFIVKNSWGSNWVSILFNCLLFSSIFLVPMSVITNELHCSC